MYYVILIIMVAFILFRLIKSFMSLSEEETERLWSVELAGFSFKLIALGLFMWMLFSGVFELEKTEGENWEQVLADSYFMIIGCVIIYGIGAIVSKISGVVFELQKIRSSSMPAPVYKSNIQNNSTPSSTSEYWFCGNCGTKCMSSSEFCANCGSKKATIKNTPSAPPAPKPKVKIDSNNEWKCPSCGEKNNASYISCRNCGKYK